MKARTEWWFADWATLEVIHLELAPDAYTSHLHLVVHLSPDL